MPASDPVSLSKFGYRIRTRGGTPVDNLVVQARDREEADRKIGQMYPQCEIVERRVIHTAIGDDAVSLETIITQISSQRDEEP